MTETLIVALPTDISTRHRCRRCGDRLEEQVGQDDNDGDLSRVLRCVCGWVWEQRPEPFRAEFHRRLARINARYRQEQELDQGTEIEMLYDPSPFPESEF